MAGGGYGYSVWYVPYNYEQLQAKYNIAHIPHVTLETNLSLRDAFHIYHNQKGACPDITIELDGSFVKFPSYYPNDPMQYYGWDARIVEMKRPKLKWKPHISVVYTPRNSQIAVNQAMPQPPQGKIQCFLVIADTRSSRPADWHMNHTYFNIKASQSYTLAFDISPKCERRVTSTIDEYFGTNKQELPTFRETFKTTMKERGITMTEAEVSKIMNAIDLQVNVRCDENDMELG